MSQQQLIAKCLSCQEKIAQASVDKNNPFFGGDDEFGIVLEWKNKEEILKEVAKTKCPKCGSDNWFLTDVAEH